MSESTVEHACPHCGAECASQAFCPACGHRLTPARRSRWKETFAGLVLVLALGALGFGCFVGIPYGVVWTVSLAFPPLREHLWAATFGLLFAVAGWRKLNWSIGRWRVRRLEAAEARRTEVDDQGDEGRQ